ncbi:MAG: cupredoxin family protein [Betaproteobacteria bacterium]
MAFAFQYHHGAMLLKYSGISFISGAVNHGFFSGERSLWTAAAGMVLFVLGAVLEHRLRQDPQQPSQGLLRTLFIGALLSVGLGFFTGGLQHFPDSPARSAWVVPLGFVVSVMALAMDGAYRWLRSSWVYSLVVGALVSVGSYSTWQWLERQPAAGHSHADDQGLAVAAPAITAMVVDRSIDILMDDQMRFTPNTLEVQAGETVRLVVRNEGKVQHELVLGTDQQIREHADQMKQGGANAAHRHDSAGFAVVGVEAGQTGELVIRWAQPGNYQMACLVPGHYEAGMRGTLTVSASAPVRPALQAPAQGHSDHKH